MLSLILENGSKQSINLYNLHQPVSNPSSHICHFFSAITSCHLNLSHSQAPKQSTPLIHNNKVPPSPSLPLSLSLIKVSCKICFDHLLMHACMFVHAEEKKIEETNYIFLASQLKISGGLLGNKNIKTKIHSKSNKMNLANITFLY